MQLLHQKIDNVSPNLGSINSGAMDCSKNYIEEFEGTGGICDTSSMSEMSLQEAQLFRMLVSFFGQERVLWGMSVKAVCGGEYPHLHDLPVAATSAWADGDRCLFTVVDEQDEPKMVVEFAPDYSRYIEVDRLDRHTMLPRLLGARGVQYVTMTAKELDEIIDPGGTLDLVAFLQDKFEVDEGGEEAM
jgi:hypothetical protein